MEASLSTTYAEGRCNLCKHYVNLTETELCFLLPTFIKLGIDKDKINGACIRHGNNKDLLIRYFLKGDEKNCIFFEKGFYFEKLNSECPHCKKGNLVLRRPKVDLKTRIMFGCERYPACNYIGNIIKLSTCCKFCGSPLELHSGDIMRVSCPKCKRPLNIPVSFNIWPTLSRPEGGCIHSMSSVDCNLCDQSRSEKRSLLEIELPMLAQYMKEHPMTSENKPRDIHEILMEFEENYDVIADISEGRFGMNDVEKHKYHIEDAEAINPDEVIQVLENHSVPEEEDFDYYNEEFGDGDE
jgi:ssDNA-binding Zn-finger/Zn-ribbon topoisomerase 1